eukprot:3641436-Pleurochrysis_carterae.AAC.1
MAGGDGGVEGSENCRGETGGGLKLRAGDVGGEKSGLGPVDGCAGLDSVYGRAGHWLALGTGGETDGRGENGGGCSGNAELDGGGGEEMLSEEGLEEGKLGGSGNGACELGDWSGAGE